MNTLILILFTIFSSSSGSIYMDPFSINEPPKIIQAEYDKTYTNKINRSISYMFIYRKEVSSMWPARISVTSNDAESSSPILVVVKKPRSVESWQIPYNVEVKDSELKYTYPTSSRTICPDIVRADDEDLLITISTSSSSMYNFELKTVLIKNFTISVSEEPKQLVASPSQPNYFYFKFNVTESVLLEVGSTDDICMTLSIQNVSCPVVDLELNIQYKGLWQTVTSKGGMLLKKSEFPLGLFIVFVVHSNDYDCSGKVNNQNNEHNVLNNKYNVLNNEYNVLNNKDTVLNNKYNVLNNEYNVLNNKDAVLNNEYNVLNNKDAVLNNKHNVLNKIREKNIYFSFKKNISDDKYMFASLALLSIFACIYVVSFLLVGITSFRCCPKQPSAADMLSPEEPTTSGEGSAICEIATAVTSVKQRHRSGSGSNTSVRSGDSSLDETDIDALEDMWSEKDILRTRKYLFVSDLSRKEHRILSTKSQLYFWNLITIAIFYSLPVVQLVLTYQKVLNDSGNQDLCYYNYLCSHPFGSISDVNHIISNIGYVFLGFLFMLITVTREKRSLHQKHLGIPQHYGFYYALGMSLVMEGVLSACYHVCPSHSNFQFDTSFMYIMAMLSMLTIYQKRHPDINASAYSTFAALAFIIFIGMIGVLGETPLFNIIFSVIHLIVCLFLSAQIYYMGRWKLDSKVCHRILGTWWSDIKCGPRHWCHFMYPSRLLLLILGNLFNWAIAGVQLKYHFVNFGTYFLAIFMVNLCLYLMFYIMMKLFCGERITKLTLFHLISSFIFWGGALFYFVNKSISWQLTPAQSRTFNQPCVILQFYDRHDVWHVLSAVSLFFSFMALLTIDDDIKLVDRKTIPVF